MMDWAPFEGDSDIIQDNSLLGGELAAGYLIDRGYRRIACIAGPLDKTPARLRPEGFKSDGGGGAFVAAGIYRQRRF